MSIAPLSRALKHYIITFNLAAVCRYRDNRLGVSRHPPADAMVWWCHANDAGTIVKLARRMDNDIPGAAARLRLAATPHDRVIERASAAIERIATGLARANGRGTIGFFNSEYRQRRLEAAAQGRGFMSYRSAQTRLRRALTDKIASQLSDSASLIARVFK